MGKQVIKCVVCTGEFFESDMTTLVLSVIRKDNGNMVVEDIKACKNCATDTIRDFRSCLAEKGQLRLF
ncbi:unnamed protein product [marine sediment metagenome]|uniref:Uncharacterized protein n=1 Tax=marine sediment metagenome TaxID=412755 RepID=X0WCI0_9ZZZZ